MYNSIPFNYLPQLRTSMKLTDDRSDAILYVKILSKLLHHLRKNV